jgi:hypothetical protein
MAGGRGVGAQVGRRQWHALHALLGWVDQPQSRCVSVRLPNRAITSNKALEDKMPGGALRR